MNILCMYQCFSVNQNRSIFHAAYPDPIDYKILMLGTFRAESCIKTKQQRKNENFFHNCLFKHV